MCHWRLVAVRADRSRRAALTGGQLQCTSAIPRIPTLARFRHSLLHWMTAHAVFQPGRQLRIARISIGLLLSHCSVWVQPTGDHIGRHGLRHPPRFAANPTPSSSCRSCFNAPWATFARPARILGPTASFTNDLQRRLEFPQSHLVILICGFRVLVTFTR